MYLIFRKRKKLRFFLHIIYIKITNNVEDYERKSVSEDFLIIVSTIQM